MPGVIDFECENDRRIEAGIIADSWRWQNIRLQLNETMATSELPETLLVSAIQLFNAREIAVSLTFLGIGRRTR
jgi:hypothetical protein